MIIAPEHPGTDIYKVDALVLKVFDGDGFLARIKASELTGNPWDKTEVEVPIRCGFIDAPEMNQPGGPEARAFLASLIASRSLELVILTKQSTGGSYDRHGRIVCVPYLIETYLVGEFRTSSNEIHSMETFGGELVVPRNIELEMVVNGWAWVIERYEPDERYFQALEDARRHKRGIWAFENNVNPNEFKRRKYRASAQVPAPAPLLDFEGDAACPNEGCGGRLVNRMGRFGAFLGCSKFPSCKYSRSKNTNG